MTQYTESEHRHRFAAWCASTASSVTGFRFKVEQGAQIICDSGLSDLSNGWDRLPEPDNFDEWHNTMRDNVIKSSNENLEPIEFTHGIAAKLINVYLKSLFLSYSQNELSGINLEKRNAIHPPLDRELSKSLCKIAKNHSLMPVKNTEFRIAKYNNIWKYTWSSLTSSEYQKIIDAIKFVTQEGGLWTIEKYWRGYQ